METFFLTLIFIAIVGALIANPSNLIALVLVVAVPVVFAALTFGGYWFIQWERTATVPELLLALVAILLVARLTERSRPATSR